MKKGGMWVNVNEFPKTMRLCNNAQIEPAIYSSERL